MEFTDVALKLRQEREALEKKYGLAPYTPSDTSGIVDFNRLEAGGLVPQKEISTDAPLDYDEVDAALKTLGS
jgi:hypothetical protein